MYVLYVNTLYHLKINEKDIYDSQIIKRSPFFVPSENLMFEKRRKRLVTREAATKCYFFE